MRLLMVCESEADFRTVSELCDRVLREKGPAWIADMMEGASIQEVRSWQSDGRGHEFIRVHDLIDLCMQHGVRLQQGHFDGEPGSAMAQVARNAFGLAKHLVKTGAALDAVLFIGDMDGQGEERRRGYRQARDEKGRGYSFKILLGCPDAKREAWVLNGFDSQNDDEKRVLGELRQALGFSPVEESHRLDATDEHAKRSAKRVLKLLVGDYDRERQCWAITPLETLASRGDGSGLAAFLAEVETTLLPLCTKQ